MADVDDSKNKKLDKGKISITPTRKVTPISKTHITPTKSPIVSTAPKKTINPTLSSSLAKPKLAVQSAGKPSVPSPSKPKRILNSHESLNNAKPVKKIVIKTSRKPTVNGTPSKAEEHVQQTSNNVESTSIKVASPKEDTPKVVPVETSFEEEMEQVQKILKKWMQKLHLREENIPHILEYGKHVTEAGSTMKEFAELLQERVVEEMKNNDNDIEELKKQEKQLSALLCAEQDSEEDDEEEIQVVPMHQNIPSIRSPRLTSECIQGDFTTLKMMKSPAISVTPGEEVVQHLKPTPPLLDLSRLGDLNNDSSYPKPLLSPHPLTPKEEQVRLSVLSEIRSPRKLKPAVDLRKDAKKREISSEGVLVKSLDDSDRVHVNAAHLNFSLKNRPTPEELKRKHIFKEQTDISKDSDKNLKLKHKLKQLLARRASVVAVEETKIVQEASQGRTTETSTTEVVSYTKNVKSHLYGISLYVLEQQMWCSAGDTLRVYDSDTGKIQQMIDAKTAKNKSIRCILVVGQIGNRQIWCGSTDNRIQVFDAQTYHFVKVLKGHNAAIKCMINVGNTVWSGSSDGCVCIWDSKLPIQLLHQLQCHTRSLNTLCLAPNGHVWTGSDDKTIRVVNPANNHFVKKLRGHMDYITCLAVVGNRIWSGSEDKSVGVWDVKSFKFVKRLPHNKAVKCVASVKEFGLTGSIDGQIKVWDARKMEWIRDLESYNYGVNCLFSYGTFVWCAYVDQFIKVFEVSSWKLSKSFKLSESYSVDFMFKESQSSDAMDDDYVPVFELINNKMQDDPDCSHVLPLDLSSLSSCMGAVQDGSVLCKLLGEEVPGLIDLRVVNKKPKKQEVIQNLNLLLNSANVLGCDTTETSADAFLNNQADTVFPFVWQLVEAALFADMATRIKSGKEFEVLLEQDEDLPTLSKLPPEEILLRWFNYHLKKSGSKRTVNNFTTDLQDCECYHLLLNQLSPSCNLNGSKETSQDSSAAAVISNAKKINCGKFIRPNHIVEGQHLMNIALVAELFKKATGLPLPVEEVEIEEVDLTEPHLPTPRKKFVPIAFPDKLKIESKDREIRSFLAWLNSFQLDPFVVDLFDDLRDGLILLKIVDKLHPKIVDWKKVNLNPDNTFKRTENCNYFIKLCHNLGLSMKGIAGQDIEQGKENLTLAMLWQLMRYDILNFIKNLKYEGQEVNETMMINWANKKVEEKGHFRATIESFRDPSIKTGHFLIDLLHTADPNAVNFDLVEAGITAEQCIKNAQYALSVAWKIGCSIYCLYEDIVEVNQKMILIFVAAIMIFSKDK